MAADGPVFSTTNAVRMRSRRGSWTHGMFCSDSACAYWDNTLSRGLPRRVRSRPPVMCTSCRPDSRSTSAHLPETSPNTCQHSLLALSEGFGQFWENMTACLPGVCGRKKQQIGRAKKTPAKVKAVPGSIAQFGLFPNEEKETPEHTLRVDGVTIYFCCNSPNAVLVCSAMLDELPMHF